MYGRGGGARVIDLPLLNGCVIVACSFPRKVRCLAAASYTGEYPLPDPPQQERAPQRCVIRTPNDSRRKSIRRRTERRQTHTCCASSRAWDWRWWLDRGDVATIRAPRSPWLSPSPSLADFYNWPIWRQRCWRRRSPLVPRIEQPDTILDEEWSGDPGAMFGDLVTRQRAFADDAKHRRPVCLCGADLGQ